MTETRIDEAQLERQLWELATVQQRINEVTAERDAAYARRADLFLALSEAGVTQAALGEATGIGMQAVGQNIARARTRREAANMAG